jgi:Flp pilus assembly protein CpaB
MSRLIYLVACLALAGIAGFIYYGQTQEASAVVAGRDLTVGERITAADLDLKRVPVAAVPAGAISAPDQAIGQFVAFPVMAGQYLTPRHLVRDPTGASLTGGLPVPPGDRIVSLPATPASALGGALAPGDLVDVIAVPDPGKGAAGPGLDPAGNTVLGQRVLVVGVRSDQGAPLQPDAGTSTANTRLGSVLLAIADSDEQKYAAAIASDSFVLALVTG